MRIVTLLHLYQPHNQQFDILDRIVNESYRPLLNGLSKTKKGKVVINISGGLTKLLIDNGYQDVIDTLKKLVKDNKIEFTSSAMYHAFLPLLPKEEIVRQIQMNDKTNKEVFGKFYKPIGFFSPEMAINDKVINIVSELGYKWIAASQMAHPEGNPSLDTLYQKDSTFIFFRNKKVSSLMLSGVVRTPDQLIEQTTDLHTDNGYFFVVMDGETFGHHRVGHEDFFLSLMAHDLLQPTLASEILESNLLIENTEIRPSTWTNEEQDFWLDKDRIKKTEAKSFILWQDPDNPIHKLQWELTHFVVDKVNKEDDKGKARNFLDKAISSDQYWWASTKPWWSLELIEQGAHSLKEVLLVLFGEDSTEYKHALDLYRKILDQAFVWQREGVIRKRHLDNSATHMKKPFKDRAPAEWFNQIMLEFEDQMNTAASNRCYEEAIKWRDALIKIEQGTDIYDVLHVVDELWSARNIPVLKPFLEYDWDEISPYIKKYFRDVKTKEDFEVWKNKKL